MDWIRDPCAQCGDGSCVQYFRGFEREGLVGLESRSNTQQFQSMRMKLNNTVHAYFCQFAWQFAWAPHQFPTLVKKPHIEISLQGEGVAELVDWIK